MQFEWDPKKAIANERKYEVTFREDRVNVSAVSRAGGLLVKQRSGLMKY